MMFRDERPDNPAGKTELGLDCHCPCHTSAIEINHCFPCCYPKVEGFEARAKAVEKDMEEDILMGRSDYGV